MKYLTKQGSDKIIKFNKGDRREEEGGKKGRREKAED